jgi:hypothetical protein
VSYEDACRKAATDQGLDPVIEALTTAGIDHQVEQTGGFTMVVTVKVPAGTFAITVDGPYVLGFYTDDSWDAHERDDATYTSHTRLDTLIDRIKNV